MAKWVKAQYDSERKIAEYTDAQGNHLIRTGGSLPWRLNNPGNLRPRMEKGVPAPIAVKSHIGFAKVKNSKGEDCYFLIFPDYETGVNEIRNNLKRLYSKQTIQKAIDGYAPPTENNTDKYISDAEKISGLSRKQIVGELSANEFERLVKAIIKIEGYEDQSKGARNEQMVAVSSVTLSDGAKPLAGQTMVLEQGGKTTQVTSSDTGLLPPIVHQLKLGPINIQIPDENGILKTILSIDMAAEAKNFLLVTEQKIYRAFAGPHASPQPETKQEGRSFPYPVQSGDTLAKIAKKFNTTVERIQKDNGIKGTQIYAGKSLTINLGNASTPSAQSTKPATSVKSVDTKKPVAKAQAEPTKDAKDEKDLWDSFIENITTFRSRFGFGAPAASMSSDPKQAPWMQVAVKEIQKWSGYHENQAAIDTFNNKEKNIKKGIRSKGIITTNYHKEIGFGGSNLATAWCAAFANYCIKNGYGADYFEKSQSSQFPVNNKKFVKIDKPVYGALVVYKHTKKEYGLGHVGFVYAKLTNGDYAILGGNQGDSITLNAHKETYINYIRAKLVGFYVPATYHQYALNVLSKGDDFGGEKTMNEVKKAIGDQSGVTTSTR